MTEPARYARTLVEAHVHIGLTAAEAEAEAEGDEALGETIDQTTLTEGTDAWTLRYEGAGGPPIEVLVRYADEAEARRYDLRFGTGVSELVDAGQWVQVAAIYARRARRESLFFAENPTGEERYRSIVDGWGLARDATIEAIKFLTDDAEELGDDAFWTAMGTSARRESPERFTRERLEDDITFCERSLEAFQRLHAG
ncbi:hypothetical protein [Actinoallomurus acaciae]|uniref:Uncharacterized protein n=1 Tax=Actinoallomurus acaciae TaxID=502577 RepID=A0ABV5YRT0_9ACTN